MSVEHDVLCKGISFVPPTRFYVFTWIKDLHLFVQKLKWRKFLTLNDRKLCRELGLKARGFVGGRHLGVNFG